MSSEIYVSLIRYSLGIIVVISLIFSLMEASRKYDRHRDLADLALSCGFFLLVIWGLVRTVVVDDGMLYYIASVCQSLGLSALAVGYWFMRPLTPHIKEASIASDTPLKNSKVKKNNPRAWIKLLVEPQELPAPPPDEEEKTTEPPAKDLISESNEGEKAEIDLSYLASRQGLKKVEPPKKVTLNPKKSDQQREKREKRSEILDELFPIKQHAVDEPLITPTEKQTESRLPRENITDSTGPKTIKPIEESAKEKLKVIRTAKVARKRRRGLGQLAIGLVPTMSLYPLADLVLGINIILIGFIIVGLAKNRHYSEKLYTVVGFLCLLVSQLLLVASINSSILAKGLLSDLLISLFELVGFICLGVGSWLRVRGRITHYFLRLIVSVGVGLLLLTIVLTSVFVHDPTSLQLTLLFSTGLLIALLPVLYTFAQNHNDSDMPAD